MFYIQNISIYIYKFLGSAEGGGRTWSTVRFLFIIQKNWKRTRARPILKSNSTSIWFKCFFSRVNNKKIRKGGPKILRKRGQDVDVTELKWTRRRTVIPSTLCGQSPCLWGRRGLGARYSLFFIIYFPTFTFSYFKSMLLLQFSSYMVGQVALCSGITPLQFVFRTFLNYCT